MKSKVLLFLILMSVTFSSEAIRHVGNAGGDAELKLQEMNVLWPVWAAACNQNQDLCWKGGEVPARIVSLLPTLKLDFSEAGASFQGDLLILKNSDLYEADEKTPLSDVKLAEIFLQTLFKFQGFALPKKLDLSLLPKGNKTFTKDVYLLNALNTDVLVAPLAKRSLHQELVEKMQCQEYRFAEILEDGFAVRCMQDLHRYQVYILGDEANPVLQVLYDGENSLTD